MNLIVSLLFCITFDIGDAVEKLRPDVSVQNKEIVVRSVSTRASKYGILPEDYPLILAMVKKESNFTHMHGSHGEIGMLQVIPEDGHIMEIVENLVCDDSEKFCKNGIPDVSSNGKLASWKVRRFLEQHPKYALETGFGEMQYWKQTYETRLKARYWTKFPVWHLKNNLDDYETRENSLRFWWKNLVEKAGDYVWISHYNWGNRMSTAVSSRNYALQVVAIMKTI